MRRAMAAQDHRYAIPTEIQLELDPPWRRSSRRNSRDIYICKQQAKNRSKPQKTKKKINTELVNCAKEKRKLSKIEEKTTKKKKNTTMIKL